MYAKFPYIWLVYMINVGQYIIHGWYGGYIIFAYIHRYHMHMHIISLDEYFNAECLTEIVDALLSQSNSRESQKIVGIS